VHHFIPALPPHAHALLCVSLICFGIVSKSRKACGGQKNYHSTDGSNCSYAVSFNILHNESPYSGMRFYPLTK
jgi:hypothetical protein